MTDSVSSVDKPTAYIADDNFTPCDIIMRAREIVATVTKYHPLPWWGIAGTRIRDSRDELICYAQNLPDSVAEYIREGAGLLRAVVERYDAALEWGHVYRERAEALVTENACRLAALEESEARAAELSRRLSASEAARNAQYEHLTASHDAATLALISQVDTLTAALTALTTALDAEEAHTRQRAGDDLRWYCAEGQRLRDETRRCRERAAAVLTQETTT